MAASLLLACLAGYSWWQSGKAPAPTPAPVVRQEEKAVPQPPAPPLVRNPQKANPTPKTPSLTETVQDAQSALVQLGQRTAEETVEGGRHLMPREVPTPPEANTGLLTETLDPPARSLAEAGQDVSVGLEPVTNSAKRAVNLFLEEIPPVQSGKKTGW